MPRRTRRVIIELPRTEGVPALSPRTAAARGAFSAADVVAAVPALAGIRIDPSFPPTPVPDATTLALGPTPAASPGAVAMAFAMEPGGGHHHTPPSEPSEPEAYILRGEMDVEEDDDGNVVEFADNRAAANAMGGSLTQIYVDARIEVCPICPGDGPRGTDADVARLLCTERLHSLGMDGAGVTVAIVDSGINLGYLNARGKNPRFDAAQSWAPVGGGVPGSQPVDHGTMCAFDVCIAAPRCTLLDISLLQSSTPGATAMEGFLSDAVLAYSHLLRIMSAPRRPGAMRSLVVNNSWGMFHPSWDFPVGHSGNYSDNPNHPFNRIVASLDRAGADILFAAGNCGANCPDGRCRGVTARAIYGANSHSQVLCVGGVDVSGVRVGYSSIGPGRLTNQKPDVCGFTHFQGSGVYPADGGTSAATPVVAGLVAALRSRRPSNPLDPTSSPEALRRLLRRTALDRSLAGFDFEYGWGIVNACLLSRMIRMAPEAGPQGVELLERELIAANI